jgi:hypothetical protein
VIFGVFSVPRVASSTPLNAIFDLFLGTEFYQNTPPKKRSFSTSILTSILITFTPHFILLIFSRPSGITHTHKNIIDDVEDEKGDDKFMLAR